jgi:hypothetical protein
VSRGTASSSTFVAHAWEAPSRTRCGATWVNPISNVPHVCYEKPHAASTPHVCGRKKGTTMNICRVRWIVTDRGEECLTTMGGYVRQPHGTVQA